MIKFETFDEEFIYINSKFIQSIRESNTLRKGSVITVCNDSYLVKGSPEYILKTIKEAGNGGKTGN